jgi:hypothetical protein
LPIAVQDDDRPFLLDRLDQLGKAPFGFTENTDENSFKFAPSILIF